MTFRCQFHQRFYVRIFRTNVVLAAFSRYILALNKLSYEKCARIMLMKLKVDGQKANHRFSYQFLPLIGGNFKWAVASTLTQSVRYEQKTVPTSPVNTTGSCVHIFSFELLALSSKKLRLNLLVKMLLVKWWWNWPLELILWS